MKEATSELSSMVVVTICVAILIAFFFFVIWPDIRTNFEAQTACEKATCNVSKGINKGFYKECIYEGKNIKCKFKG